MPSKPSKPVRARKAPNREPTSLAIPPAPSKLVIPIDPQLLALDEINTVDNATPAIASPKSVQLADEGLGNEEPADEEPADEESADEEPVDEEQFVDEEDLQDQQLQPKSQFIDTTQPVKLAFS